MDTPKSFLLPPSSLGLSEEEEARTWKREIAMPDLLLFLGHVAVRLEVANFFCKPPVPFRPKEINSTKGCFAIHLRGIG